MLFNSHFFIFVFLPVSAVVYYMICRQSHQWALRWVIVSSLIFYAWWRPQNVLIIVPAIVFNYLVARVLQSTAARDNGSQRLAILIAGIVVNLLLLGYFKYTNFALTVVHDLFDTEFVLRQIILPLGISFITFQQIAFIVDVYGGKVEEFRFQDYCSFVLFFPQLIAGPIVHYREMMPQFHAAPGRWNTQDVTIGLTLFFYGLFKKVVLADGVAPFVSALYSAADQGQNISLIPAWLGAAGFTFQIYFDFSGYSDMALGAARLFGIRLPVNFNSPLRASNIIDFWLRWHVSLTRFLTAYVYNPLALTLTRRRLMSGRDTLMGNRGSMPAFLQLLAAPTILTMLISGLWHGAGYTFLAWGLLHGAYLTVNHGWRYVVARLFPGPRPWKSSWKPLGFLLTFVCVVVSMVVFRSQSLGTAFHIIGGMFAFNGIEVPGAIYSRLTGLQSILQFLGISAGLPTYIAFWKLGTWVVCLAAIALLLPNSLDVTRKYDPAIGFSTTRTDGFVLQALQWKPTLPWIIFSCLVVFTAVYRLSGYTEFLYWQF
jgi:D-alanyl-lipoteichoic acid acyltransferase DltB (MBOAT superfamily)